MSTETMLELDGDQIEYDKAYGFPGGTQTIRIYWPSRPDVESLTTIPPEVAPKVTHIVFTPALGYCVSLQKITVAEVEDVENLGLIQVGRPRNIRRN